MDFFLERKNCGTCPNKLRWLHGNGCLYRGKSGLSRRFLNNVKQIAEQMSIPSHSVRTPVRDSASSAEGRLYHIGRQTSVLRAATPRSLSTGFPRRRVAPPLRDTLECGQHQRSRRVTRALLSRFPPVT
jgi:hypothetical protein